MIDTYGAMAAAIPDSTAAVELYACGDNHVPAATIHVCNLDSRPHRYNVYLTGVAGVTGDVPLVSSGINRIGGSPQQIGGVALKAGQTIRVQSDEAGMLAFTLFGLEVS